MGSVSETELMPLPPILIDHGKIIMSQLAKSGELDAQAVAESVSRTYEPPVIADLGNAAEITRDAVPTVASDGPGYS